MGQYGGQSTVMADLEVGTTFYVCNGNWNGEIVLIDDVKHLRIIGGNSISLVQYPNYSLDISEVQQAGGTIKEEVAKPTEEKGEGRMKCSYCKGEKERLFLLPVTVMVKRSDGGEGVFTLKGDSTTGICDTCLEKESDVFW